MQKKFYVSKTSSDEEKSAPDLDRFRRIEQLNLLLSLGWKIKSFVNEQGSEFFILEK